VSIALAVSSTGTTSPALFHHDGTAAILKMPCLDDTTQTELQPRDYEDSESMTLDQYAGSLELKSRRNNVQYYFS